MPVINCPECGGNVSDAAPACPHCGHPTGPATPLAYPLGSDKDRKSRKRYPDLDNDPPPPPAPPEHWTATHLIPEGRLVARDVPNANAPALFRSQALVEVQVVETKGVWARITTEDGWTTWVDGRRLVEIEGA